MEIRFMKSNELQSVILLVKGVYEKCAKSYISSPALIGQFYDYIGLESLSQKLKSGELYIWGALDGQILCGIGAMQNSAHISMLYVHPMYQRQGIGTRLLYCMMDFAANDLRARRVTAHIIPAPAAPFFYRRGYAQIANVHAGPDMVPLQHNLYPVNGNDAEIYPTKPVKEKTIVWIVVIFFLLAFFISCGTTIHYLFTL